ncbi:hypothetical protein [Verrucomicrobium sp. BvORR106]|uniref:hypothetical protein n=1 Tax=Verrucomicrobium sp. BvORR106 TaxID=1403819 RepID=UPI002240F2F4|nr:hypothetical protein [Verrucomicrobium sp. BvORR106]
MLASILILPSAGIAMAVHQQALSAKWGGLAWFVASLLGLNLAIKISSSLKRPPALTCPRCQKPLDHRTAHTSECHHCHHQIIDRTPYFAQGDSMP